jgi:hypothetical protein
MSDPVKASIKEMYSLAKTGWRASCNECEYVEEGDTKVGVQAHMLDHVRVTHLGWHPRHPRYLDRTYNEQREANKDKDWSVRPVDVHLVANCWCGAKGI